MEGFVRITVKDGQVFTEGPDDLVMFLGILELGKIAKAAQVMNKSENQSRVVVPPMGSLGPLGRS